MNYNYAPLRRELLRSIRGQKSQNFINRKLNFHYNQVYRWESGYTSISWTNFLKFASACKVDVDLALKKIILYSNKSDRYDLLVRHLVGDTSIKTISKLLGKSRFTVGRWLNKQSEPSLDDILSLIHLQALVLGEFLEAMVPLDQLSTLGPDLKLPLIQKKLFYSDPRIAAVIRCFELKDYLALRVHKEGFIANKLGISIASEIELLKKLTNTKVIRKTNGKYIVQLVRIDTRGDFIGNTNIKKYWTQAAYNYLQQLNEPSTEAIFGYHVFSASAQVCAEIKKEMLDFQARIKALIGTDREPAENLLVLNFQVFNPENVLPNILNHDELL